MELDLSLAVASFVAGVLMFLAPCTLPLIPAFLVFIGGSKDAPVTLSRLILRNSALFVLGFSLVFVSFGILAGFFGAVIGPLRSLLTQVGGLFIIVLGLYTLGVFKSAHLQGTFQIPYPRSLQPGTATSSLLIGIIFALGWTPCVGPILASIILLATSSSTVLQGGVLLSIFSLGLAVPFMLTAVFYTQLSGKILKHGTTISSWVTFIGGVFLVGIGSLLLFDDFGLTVQYGAYLFNALGIENIFNYY